MNIISRIACGAFVDAPKEVWDFASKDVLSTIRKQFKHPANRPDFLFNPIKSLRTQTDFNEPTGSCEPIKELWPQVFPQEKINDLVVENDIMLKHILEKVENE